MLSHVPKSLLSLALMPLLYSNIFALSHTFEGLADLEAREELVLMGRNPVAPITDASIAGHPSPYRRINTRDLYDSELGLSRRELAHFEDWLMKRVASMEANPLHRRTGTPPASDSEGSAASNLEEPKPSRNRGHNKRRPRKGNPQSKSSKSGLQGGHRNSGQSSHQHPSENTGGNPYAGGNSNQEPWRSPYLPTDESTQPAGGSGSAPANAPAASRPNPQANLNNPRRNGVTPSGRQNTRPAGPPSQARDGPIATDRNYQWLHRTDSTFSADSGFGGSESEMGEPGHDSQLSRRGQGLSISDLESLLNLQRRDEFEDIFDLERRDDDFFDFERRDSDILSDLSMSQREETAVEKTGECKEEGLWNCIEESKFQTCSSGTWVELKNVVMGTKCANGLGLGLYITAV